MSSENKFKTGDKIVFTHFGRERFGIVTDLRPYTSILYNGGSTIMYVVEEYKGGQYWGRETIGEDQMRLANYNETPFKFKIKEWFFPWLRKGE